MTTGSPTRYKSYDDLLDRLDEITKRTEAQSKKLQDNFNQTLREIYEDNIKQLQSINDPYAQYQKQDENDIQCKLNTTIISTTMGTSPTRYDLQGIYNINKQYREAQTTRVINLQSSAHHSNDRQEDNIIVASQRHSYSYRGGISTFNTRQKTLISHRQNDTQHRQKDTPHRQKSSYRQKDTPYKDSPHRQNTSHRQNDTTHRNKVQFPHNRQ
eukprot:scaffold4673_cov61-Attheya_sp.AAC.3